MTRNPGRLRPRAAAVAAAALGAASAASGLRVLAGADPGYVVLRWLVVYNVLAGFASLAAAAALWRSGRLGASLAIWILRAHAIVLLALVVRRAVDWPVAGESLAAMTLRVAVWTTIAIAAVPEIRRL